MSRLTTTRQNKQSQQSTRGIDSAAVLAITSTNKMSVYSGLDSLPTTGLVDGTKALVESDLSGNTRLYVADGSGWYNKTAVNIAPTIDSIEGFSLNSTLNKSDSANYTVIASDSDDNDAILSYSYVATPSNIIDSAITITQDSSVFNIAVDSAATSDGFNLVFRATDNINIATSSKDFTIIQPIQRNITPYHVHAPSGGMAAALPNWEFREDDNAAYTNANISKVADEITTAIEGASPYTFAAENPAYGTVYITCWDSSGCTYAAAVRRSNPPFVFPAQQFTYDPDSNGGNDGIWAGRQTTVAAGVAGDLFPSDTHYHRRDTESFTDTSLATLGFRFRNYKLFATTTVFNDGSGNTTYYHNTGTAGVAGGSTTGSATTFREIRLYAGADTTNLIWTAPVKF